MNNFFLFILARPIYFLYLFQLENYNVSRFFSLSLNRLRHSAFRRQQLVWTPKTKLLFTVALLLLLIDQIFTALIVYYLFSLASVTLVIFIISILLSLYLFFAHLIVASWLLYPLDKSIKATVIARARRKLKKFDNLTIIAITGSYGKTTMKEVLATTLSAKFKVFKTPDNINTPLGIARLITSQLESDTEVFIVEMGAYQVGDIAQLCRLTPPDISILTGINESHLERFGSLDNTISAKFEIVTSAKPDTLIVLNVKDKNILANYPRFVGQRQVILSSAYKPVNLTVLPAGRGQTFTLESRQGSLGPLTLPFVATYITNVSAMATIIAKHLKLDDNTIRLALARSQPAPHRLNATLHPNDVLVIDDSYNGNPAGVREAIATIKQFKDRRRIFVTPGLVELGDQAGTIHYELGRELADSTDLVCLISTSASYNLKRGLTSAGFSIDAIKEYPTMNDFQTELSSLIKPGDVILFQNDWPDNYA